MDLSIDKSTGGFMLPLEETAHKVSIFTYVLVGIILSSYFFPFGFTFLPTGLNTKMMLAFLAMPLLGIKCIQKRSVQFNRELIPAMIFVVLFSIIGYISVDINHADDYTYANYWVSFGTWLLGAYTTCSIIQYVHGNLNFKLLFNYLIVICVIQCFLALAIDNIPAFKVFIDAYISQDTIAEVEFLNEVERLYGIGAAVDVAGTRFSIVLIGLAAILMETSKRSKKVLTIIAYWSAFIVISIVGNMISRTTTIGMLMGILYMIFGSLRFSGAISLRKVKFWVTILMVTLMLVAVAVYFYQTDAMIREQVRFGFEGFFSWIEKGEWTTSSTERLNSVMWVWPAADDYKTWIIGKALFSNWFDVKTDIGYCRFVFYNGLLGLITFALFFVYSAWVCALKFPVYKFFFLMLLVLGFVIWLKVSTDLFIMYALFYCMGKEPK
jgi:hypothetical protein